MTNLLISEILEEDMPDILSLATKVSEKHVFPTLSKKGQDTLKNSLKKDTKDILDKEIYRALKVTQGKQIVGYIAWRHGHYIAQLYVDTTFQNKGIGTRLLNEVKKSASGSILKTRASLNAVQFYIKYGFEPIGNESEINGIKFLPMEYKV